MWNIWEKAKRNRGKLGAGVVLIGGGIYLAKKAADYYQDNIRDRRAEVEARESRDDEQLLLRERGRFLFDSHQESCDKFLRNVLSELQKLISEKFNCEELVECHRNERLNSAEKIQIWQELQLRTFSRIFTLAFSYSLTIVAFKVQKSILSRIYADAPRQKPAESASISDFFASLFVNEPKNEPATVIDPQVQQIFANCINYFTQEGVSNFCDEIAGVVRAEVGKIPLTEKFALADLRALLTRVHDRIDAFGRGKRYARFVVPNTRPAVTSLLAGSAHLQRMLEMLVGALESNACRDVLNELTDSYMDYLQRAIALKFDTDSNTAIVPMAKLIPKLGDAFRCVAQPPADGGAFTAALRSSALHRFLFHVFKD